MKRLTPLIVVLLSTSLYAQNREEIIREIEGMDWMTEQYPPFNYLDEEDGQLKGITVDILMEMFKKAGVGITRDELRILPWARAYKALLEKQGSSNLLDDLHGSTASGLQIRRACHSDAGVTHRRPQQQG